MMMRELQRFHEKCASCRERERIVWNSCASQTARGRDAMMCQYVLPQLQTLQSPCTSMVLALLARAHPCSAWVRGPELGGAREQSPRQKDGCSG